MSRIGPPNPIDIAVGGRIQLRRRLAKMSQAQLGKAIGVTFQQVQKYESGANRVSASMLVKVAYALDCSISDLFGQDAPGGGVTGDAALDKLSVPGASEWLDAFVAVPSPTMRLALLNLARSMSENGDA